MNFPRLWLHEGMEIPASLARELMEAPFLSRKDMSAFL
jgi:hypothetical protein